MKRTWNWYTCLIALTLAGPAIADELALQWASGNTAIGFSTGQRCTLVVSTGAADRDLPDEWRLVWVGSGMSDLRLVPESSAWAGARVGSVEQTVVAEAKANQITANFEQAGHPAVQSARYVMDLPGSSAGKFMIYAPSVSSGGAIIGIQRSNVVTWNGGVSDEFRPVVMGVTGDHRTTRLSIDAVGAGLSSVQSGKLQSADTSWAVPLQVVTATDSSITLEADVPVQLPDAILTVDPADTITAAASLFSSSVLAPQVQPVQTVGNSFLLPGDSTGVSPKDFAFFHNLVPTAVPGEWRNLFHLVYIRRLPNADEWTLGHAWSADLQNWTTDRYAFRTGPPGMFDALHVWAPTLVQNGNLTYMFYTGVNAAENQRTGRVATALLDTTNTDWTVLGRQMVFAADSTGWVSRHPALFFGRDQFRDPYVFPHPDSAGRFLMVYTALDSLWKAKSGLSIGLAINKPGTLDRWEDKGRFGASDWEHNGHISQVEGPIAMPDSGYVPPYAPGVSTPTGWRLLFSWGGSQSDSVTALMIRDTLAVNVADTTGNRPGPGQGPPGWGDTQNLYRYLGRDATVKGWEGLEHLKAGNVDYLAAFNAYLFDGIHISRLYWNGPNFTLRVPAVTGVDEVGAATAALRMRVLGFHPNAVAVEIRDRQPHRVARQARDLRRGGKASELAGRQGPGAGKNHRDLESSRGGSGWPALERRVLRPAELRIRRARRQIAPGPMTRLAGVPRHTIGATRLPVPDRALRVWRTGAGTCASIARVATGFLVVVLSMCADAGAQTVEQIPWGTDVYGTVLAFARSGNTLYVGGTFLGVAPITGSAVPFDAESGAPLARYPKVAGHVWRIVPDGAGGWYLGGRFDGVGGLPRRNLAHVLADGSVANWSPNPNGEIWALTVDGDMLYVGGEFSLIAGEARSNLARIHTSDGSLTTWSPSIDYLVYDIQVAGTSVYIGGLFSHVDGQQRLFLAELSVESGLLTDWSPSPDQAVRTIAISGDTLYAGGKFSLIGSTARYRLAAISRSTGAALDWDAHLDRPGYFPYDGGPAALRVLIHDGALFVAGVFTQIGGASRQGLAALTLDNARATPWDARGRRELPVHGAIFWDMAIDGNSVFVAGSFDSLGGLPQADVGTGAAVDARTGDALAWRPETNDGVYALAAANGVVYAGGWFTSLGPRMRRNGIAAFDVRTGAVTDWAPDPMGDVRAILARDGKVYIGGQFLSAGGQARSGIAEIDSATGRATDWNPSVRGAVRCLAATDSLIYAGGSFTDVGGVPRANLAAIRRSDGTVTAWRPDANESVTTVVPHGHVVYAGGSFSTLGNATRIYAGAVDADSGRATPWLADASDYVDCIAVHDTTVYLSGYFNYINGVPRDAIAAVSANTGMPTPFLANASREVKKVVYESGVLYAGGTFSFINGVDRDFVAALDPETGEVLDWNPGADAGVWALGAGVGGSTRAGSSCAWAWCRADCSRRSRLTACNLHRTRS